MKKLIALLTLILINCTAFAQIPQIVFWQGIIQDAQGNNLNGQHNVTCKLYDVATGGNAIWTEVHNNLQITDGLANISLGSVTALNLPFDKQYWLEITVGNGTPLPRIKLSSVPYSLYSAKSSGVIVNDSLVLKDSRGVTRMVLNPNTGTFKMMNNDTTWYEMSVQSPPQTITIEGDKTIIRKTDTDGSIVTIEKNEKNKETVTYTSKTTYIGETKYKNEFNTQRTIDGKELYNSTKSEFYEKKSGDEFQMTETETKTISYYEDKKKEIYKLDKPNDVQESRTEITKDGKNISNYTKIQNKDDENNDVEKTVIQNFDADGKISSTKETTFIFDKNGTTQTNEKTISSFDDSGSPKNWTESTSTKGQNTKSEKTTTYTDGIKSSESLNVSEKVGIAGTDNEKRTEYQKSYIYDASGKVTNITETSKEMIVGQTIVSQKSEEKNISYSSDGKPSNGTIKSTNYDEAGNGESKEHTITAFNSDGTPKTFQLKTEQQQDNINISSIETHQDNQIQAKETKTVEKLSNGEIKHDEVKEDYKNGIKVSAHFKSFRINSDGTETAEHEEIVYYNQDGEPISSKVLKSKLGESLLEIEKELFLNKKKKSRKETYTGSQYSIIDKFLNTDGSTDLKVIDNYIPGNGGKVNRIVVDPVNPNISTTFTQTPSGFEFNGNVKFDGDVQFVDNLRFPGIEIENGNAKTTIKTSDHTFAYNRFTEFDFAGMAPGYSAKFFPAGSYGHGFRLGLGTPQGFLYGFDLSLDPSQDNKSNFSISANTFNVAYDTKTNFYGNVQINGRLDLGYQNIYSSGGAIFNGLIEATGGLKVNNGATISGDLFLLWNKVETNKVVVSPTPSGGAGSLEVKSGAHLLVKSGGSILFETDIKGDKDINLKGVKKFKIDHPTDNTKYLQHASVESNQVLNMYSGNVTTDGNGMATVSLPSYFKEINTDYRYVLTVVGQTFAQAIVYQEINSNNQFVIKTSVPNIKVSWQVIAKRNDMYLQGNPFNDVINK